MLLTPVMILNLLVPVLGVLSELMVPVPDVWAVWYDLCVTCFMVSSIMSPWSMSSSELDWAWIKLLVSGVL